MRRTREVGVARKTPFLFYSNFFVWSWFVFLCGRFKKKNLITKDTKKNNQKHKRENFVSRQYFVRANASVYLRAQNEPRIAKLSLVLLRLFFFRRSVFFHHKDRYTLYRECSFFLISRVYFFHLFLLKKKERQIFLRSFREVGPQQMPLVRTVLPRSRAAVNEKSLIFNHAQTF